MRIVILVSLALNAAFLYMFGPVLLAQYQRMETPKDIVQHRQLQSQTVPNPAWIKSGNPKYWVADSTSMFTSKVSTGLWACDGPAVFEWPNETDETIHIVEGEVEFTYLGKTFTLVAGDTLFVRDGTTPIWNVKKRVVTSFTMYDTGFFTRIYRKLSGKKATEL